MLDGVSFAQQSVLHGGFATVPETAPTKANALFSHWSETEGGAAVNVAETPITANKIFHAVFEQVDQNITTLIHIQ